jgi:RNA polymerase sigma factor (sigma-70 family)
VVFGVAGIAPRDAAAPSSGSPESKVLQEELRHTIEGAISKLPERPRRLIEAHYAEGRSLREVSTELQVSYATVRRDHDDAIEQIREVCVRAGYESNT